MGDMAEMTNIFQVYEHIKGLPAGRKIYIRGAGYHGRRLCRELRKVGIRAAAFIDRSAPQKPPSPDVEIPVLSPGEAYGGEAKPYIICCMEDDSAYYAVRQEMELRGMREGEDFADLFIKTRMYFYEHIIYDYPIAGAEGKLCRNYRDMERQLAAHFGTERRFLGEARVANRITAMNVVVTEHCNLKCRYCNHAIPLCKAPRHFDPEAVAADLDRLLGSCEVLLVGIMGGEPLLHPRLPEILRRLAAMENLGSAGGFRITTNGTLEAPDEVLDALRAFPKPIYIFDSNYPQQSAKTEMNAQKCAAAGVLHHTSEFNTWIDCGDPSYSRNYTDAELKSLYARCQMATLCAQLHNGKFYSCGRVPVLCENGYATPDEALYVDVRNTPQGLLERKLNDFIYKTEKLSVCQHCDGFCAGSPQISKGV
ncbi:MAG: radical SAM protein [Clostridiales bacterium]|jgi:organic radical activating enzyme|nr:radical SAM protein [Clostridiales bacterium]